MRQTTDGFNTWTECGEFANHFLIDGGLYLVYNEKVDAISVATYWKRSDVL